MVGAGGQEGEPTRSDATGEFNVALISGKCDFRYKTHCCCLVRTPVAAGFLPPRTRCGCGCSSCGSRIERSPGRWSQRYEVPARSLGSNIPRRAAGVQRFLERSASSSSRFSGVIGRVLTLGSTVLMAFSADLRGRKGFPESSLNQRPDSGSTGSDQSDLIGCDLTGILHGAKKAPVSKTALHSILIEEQASLRLEVEKIEIPLDVISFTAGCTQPHPSTDVIIQTTRHPQGGPTASQIS